MQKLYEKLGSPSSERLQYILANGDLLTEFANVAPMLEHVDRTAFRALLRSIPKSIDWTPVTEYKNKLHDWNRQFMLGLLPEQIDGLTFPCHANPHQPTGISMTFGRGLMCDWKIAMRILGYEVQKIGGHFIDYTDDTEVSYYQGAEPTNDEPLGLGVALLDIGRFWDRERGVDVRTIRAHMSRRFLPALEVAWLLALNPQVYVAMDGKTVPYMWAPDLVVRSPGNAAYFCGSKGAKVSVGDGHETDRWSDSSVVIFRER